MPKDSYNVALESAKAELDDLLQKRREISLRVLRLQQTVSSLEALSEEDEAEKVTVEKQGVPFTTNLTAAIRYVFRELPNSGLTPVEVKNHLINMGVNLDKYKQPMVPIHNTLKRLAHQGELGCIRTADANKSVYRWISPFVRALARTTESPTMPVDEVLGSLDRIEYGASGMRAALRNIKERK